VILGVWQPPRWRATGTDGGGELINGTIPVVGPVGRLADKVKDEVWQASAIGRRSPQLASSDIQNGLIVRKKRCRHAHCAYSQR
jgi:hypothetical protein